MLKKLNADLIEVDAVPYKNPKNYIKQSKVIAEKLSKTNKNEYREFLNEVDDDKIKIQNSEKNFYEVTFKNKGGLVTPLIIEWTYEDGSVEIEKLPAEIWRLNETEVSKVFAKDKVVKNINLDPKKETADVNLSDNNFPRLEIKSDFEKFRN